MLTREGWDIYRAIVLGFIGSVAWSAWEDRLFTQGFRQVLEISAYALAIAAVLYVIGLALSLIRQWWDRWRNTTPS